MRTSSTSSPPIPMVDLTAIYDATATSRQRAAVVEELGRACETIGFAYLRGTPMSAEALAGARWLASEFFAEPEARKADLATRSYNPVNRNRFRGYFPVTGGDASRKEGFELGVGEAPVEERGWFLAEDNVWPDPARLPGWRERVLEYGGALMRLGLDVMGLFADYLGVERAAFGKTFAGSISTLRLIRYPEGSGQPAEADGARVSTPEHTDSGVLTLLNQDDTGGLQVMARNGRWTDVHPIPDALVMNLGDLLQHWTGGRFRATRHRVLAPRGARISFPFFLEPAATARIRPLAPSSGGARERAEPPIIYADYVLEKMRGFVEYRDLVTDLDSGSGA